MPPKKKPVQKELKDSEQVITEAALVSVENSIAPIGDKDKVIDDPVVQDLPKPQKKGLAKKQKKPIETPQETEDIELANSDVVEEQDNNPVEEVLPNPSKKTLAKKNKTPVNDAKASQNGMDDDKDDTEDTFMKELDKENAEDLESDEPAKMERSPRRGAKRGPNKADGSSSKPVKGSSDAESASVVETQGIEEESAKETEPVRRGAKRDVQKIDDAQRAPPLETLAEDEEMDDIPAGRVTKKTNKGGKTDESSKKKEKGPTRRGGKRAQKTDDATDEAAETPIVNDELAKEDVKSHPTGSSKNAEKAVAPRRGVKRGAQKADDASEAAEAPIVNDELAKEDVKSHPTGSSKNAEKAVAPRRGVKRGAQKADDASEAAEAPIVNDELAKEDVKSHPTGSSKNAEKAVAPRRGGKRGAQKADETPILNDDLAKEDVKSHPTGDSKNAEKAAAPRRGGKRGAQKADDAPPNATLVDASDEAAKTPIVNDDLAKEDVKSHPSEDSKNAEKAAAPRRGGKRGAQKADDAPPNAALVDASDEAAETPIVNDDLAKEEVISHPIGSSKNADKAMPPRRGGKRGAQKADDAPPNAVSDENDDGPSRPRRGDRKDVQAAKPVPKPEQGASGDDASDGSGDSFQGEKVAKKKKRGNAAGDKGVKKNEEPDEKKPKLDEEINYDCEKKNKAGEKWNLKISTWNVAGLRAWVKKNGVDYVKEEDADIMCFQETKCPENKVPPEAKIEGYHTFWASGKKDGYAGVALYSKEQPLEVSFGINNKEHDEEGRVITAEYEKFFLVTTYVPNSGQGLKTLTKRMDWDKIFCNYLKDLDAKKPVILCGDLNVAHEEIDLANPKTNTKSAGFTKEERENMTELLKEGFVDSFRQLYPGKTGCYTFWTYMGNARSRNTGWRLDYFVVSERLMDSVCDVVIRNKVLGSDHCPTTLFIHI